MGTQPPTLRTMVLRTLLGVAVLVIGILTLRGGPPAPPPPPPTATTLPATPDPAPATEPSASPSTTPTGDGIALLPTAPTPAPPTVAVAAAAPIVFMPDGRLVVARATGEIDLCPIVAAPKLTLPTRRLHVCDLAVSPGGDALAMAAGDGVAIWHRASNSERLLRAANATAVAWSHDGRTLASGHGGGELRLWDATTWAEAATLRPGVGAIRHLAASADNHTLAIVGDSISLWDIAARRPIRNLPADRPTAAAFSADGRLTALATAGGAPIYETTFWQRQTTLAAGQPITQLAFWRGGKTIVTSTADGSIQLWDLATRAQSATIPPAAGLIISLAPHGDDRNLATSTAAGVFIIDTATRTARPLDAR